MTESIGSREGWGVVLGGEAFDLEDWQDTLKAPFDPWVMETEEELILRSHLLDQATTSVEAYERAKVVMELVNGALGVSHRTRAVRLEGIAELLSDGTHRRHAFAQVRSIEARCKVRATAVVLGADGKRKPPEAEPSDPQRWLSVAADDDFLADALSYFARGDDWFDIYKALECLFLKFGGEREFLALGWVDASEITRLKRTANYERHARQKFEPPGKPIERVDARSLLAALIARGFQEAEATKLAAMDPGLVKRRDGE